MAIYRTVQLTFWTDTKIVDDFTPEDKYFYLYLFTNPHTNLSGCYEISITAMSNETGYSKDSVLRLLDRFENVHQVLKYSNTTKEILLLNWYKYNWQGGNQIKSIIKEIDGIKNKQFKTKMQEIFNEIFSTDDFKFTNDKPLTSPLQATVYYTDNNKCNVNDKYIFNNKCNIDNYNYLMSDTDIITNDNDYINYIHDNDMLNNCIKTWLEYKQEKGETRTIYKETSLKTLLKMFVDYDKKYGTENIISIVNESISNGYKGIIWNSLKNKSKSQMTMLERELQKKKEAQEFFEYLNGKDLGGTNNGNV